VALDTPLPLNRQSSRTRDPERGLEAHATTDEILARDARRKQHARRARRRPRGDLYRLVEVHHHPERDLLRLGVVNTIWLLERYQFDPYPFILFNLFMSAEAAYSSPLILMSQNRQTDRDREQAQHDYDTNVAAKEEIETILRELGRLEQQKLDKILTLLDRPLQSATPSSNG
jgi:hypothetical protein